MVATCLRASYSSLSISLRSGTLSASVSNSSTPTLNEEKTPEPYVLHSVWRFCDERQAAAISMMAFTGFRPQVLGNYRGNDGLRLEDLPEMRIDNKPGQITFSTIPSRVLVRQEISKIGRAYEGFLCEEGCMRLEKYLVSRITNPYSYDSGSAGREDLCSCQISGMDTRKWLKS